MNRKVLVGLGMTAGVVQVVAGVIMYLAGFYFAPWSMLVTLFLLLLCIVVGTRWYTIRYLDGKITYLQALKVGIAISICTGFVYAIYNLVSITWFYPNFLDELVRARLESDVPSRPDSASFSAMRANVTATGIAISNLIRLSVIGTLMSLLSAFMLKRRQQSTDAAALRY